MTRKEFLKKAVSVAVAVTVAPEVLAQSEPVVLLSGGKDAMWKPGFYSINMNNPCNEIVLQNLEKRIYCALQVPKHLLNDFNNRTVKYEPPVFFIDNDF